MQNKKQLINWLKKHANSKHYLFTLQDLRALLPDVQDSAFRALLSRSVAAGDLIRICHGIYMISDNMPNDGLTLFHIAAMLRPNAFNYISLETVLSDTGVISQIPTNVVSIMSSGRSNQIFCGKFGFIEFVHTKQKPQDIAHNLTYDANCHLWRANVQQALRDMKVTHRNCDLIDLELANELIRSTSK